MCPSKSIGAEAKSDLQKLIANERRQLVYELENVGREGSYIAKSTATFIRSPLSSLSNILSQRFSTTQRWEAMGLAFLVGGAFVCLGRKKEGSLVKNGKLKPALSNFVSSMADEIAVEAQHLGHKVIKDLFQSAEAMGANRMAHK